MTKGYRLRLVKGFYADGDIPVWSAVTEHYVSLAKRFLLHPNLVLLALASHDKRMIGELLDFVDEHNITFEKFAIQGFWGIQDQYYIDLKEKGYQVKIYIPYGNFLQFVWRGAKWMDRKRIMRRILGMKVI